MRLLLTLACLMLALVSEAADILILVRAREAGPVLHEGMYREPTWVLWPVADDPAQSNRLLSLPSGVDWQASPSVNAFTVHDAHAESSSQKEWERRGFFDAVRRNLGAAKVFAVAPKGGAPTTEVLKAAWTRREIAILRHGDPLPARGLAVAMAAGANPWDEVARLIERAGGRAMVVEVPDTADMSWTRLWLRGKGWPEGVPRVSATSLPGLVEARDLMALLADPSHAEWSEPLPDPPNEWLGFGHRTAPVALVFLAVGAVYILGLGVFMALREQYSRTSLFLLRLLVLGPAAVILAGRLASLTQLSRWSVLGLASIVALFLAAWLANRITAKLLPDSHPLWGEFAVGLIIAAGINPMWSMFSQLLGQHRAPISPEAFGALASYAVGANYLFSNRPLPRAIWGAIAVSATLDLLVLSRWTAPLYVGVVPLTIAACYRPILSKRVIWLASMVVVGLVGAFFLPGLVYAPDHLVHDFRQVGKFNCDEQLAFLMSPMFVSFAIVALTVGIAGGNFLGHQIRRAMSFSPNSRPYFVAAMGFGVAGVFIPLYLHAALATAIAGAVVVLFDAVRVP